MNKKNDRCPFCGVDALESATETIVQELGGVKVTVEGVPAERCRNCGELGVVGEIAIPVDDAIGQILIATGAAVAPDPTIDDALQREMAELARALGEPSQADGRPSRAAS